MRILVSLSILAAVSSCQPVPAMADYGYCSVDAGTTIAFFTGVSETSSEEALRTALRSSLAKAKITLKGDQCRLAPTEEAAQSRIRTEMQAREREGRAIFIYATPLETKAN